MAHQACTHCAGADIVVIESPAYGSVTGHMHDRSGLWWLVCARLTANGIPVVEVTPQQLKMYALGKGGGAGTGKDAVLASVIRRYPTVDITSNDTADALVLAAMGARHLGHPIESDLPALHLRAMAKLAWPI
jgi:crossover junction endodeoxyribonuclease RuvC